MAENVGTVNVNLLLGTCKTCKHWANIDKPMRGCLFVEEFTDQEKPTLFAVEDACDRYGDGPVYPCVVTGPDFACIHHEAKDG